MLERVCQEMKSEGSLHESYKKESFLRPVGIPLPELQLKGRTTGMKLSLLLHYQVFVMQLRK